MPKLITKSLRTEIIEYAKSTNQSEAARKYKVSRMYVNAIVNKRPIKNSRDCKLFNHCPITGYRHAV